MKFKFFSSLIIFFVCMESLFSQVEGTWENGGRFIEFSGINTDKPSMRIVLKPYFKYVYDDGGTFLTDIQNVTSVDGLYLLRMMYPRMKKSVWLPICVQDNFLFTSFYQRVDYLISDKIAEEQGLKESALYGFWVEQGSRDGILLYPNESPKFIDAYFFSNSVYLKFRYWQDDLDYTEKNAIFSYDNVEVQVPIMLKRGDLIYSCVTANSSVLRNYESGSYKLVYGDDGYRLTLIKDVAGPGSHSVSDVYPHATYPEVIGLPLYLTKDGKIFSYGDAFLRRSNVENLDEEIKKHNSEKKAPIEPQLVPDEIDFHLEELKKVQDLIPKQVE